MSGSFKFESTLWVFGHHGIHTMTRMAEKAEKNGLTMTPESDYLNFVKFLR